MFLNKKTIQISLIVLQFFTLTAYAYDDSAAVSGGPSRYRDSAYRDVVQAGNSYRAYCSNGSIPLYKQFNFNGCDQDENGSWSCDGEVTWTCPSPDKSNSGSHGDGYYSH